MQSDSVSIRFPGAIQFQITNLTVLENSNYALAVVKRVGGSQGTVGISYQTFGGTALPNSDYLETNGTLTFSEGELSKTIFIRLTDDYFVEPDEYFGIYLINPTGSATLGAQSNATITINDNDSWPIYGGIPMGD